MNVNNKLIIVCKNSKVLFLYNVDRKNIILICKCVVFAFSYRNLKLLLSYFKVFVFAVVPKEGYCKFDVFVYLPVSYIIGPERIERI